MREMFRDYWLSLPSDWPANVALIVYVLALFAAYVAMGGPTL